MTLDYLNQQIVAIQQESEKKIKSLQRDYAFANNPYKVGDLFTDSIGTIRIEEIKWALNGYRTAPSCVYIGTIINKNGQPNKRGEKRKAYQINEKK